MLDKLKKAVETHLDNDVIACKTHCQQLTVEVAKDKLLSVAEILRDKDEFQFEQLIDLCGVDYLTYGKDEWTTEEATTSGFERGRAAELIPADITHPRFAVVYHLLSITLNQRIRLKVYIEEDDLVVPSVINIWNGANWFEREAFDLYGILFEGHPDLRRILTDYGFIGHPFRKDFPVIGELEMRFDEDKKQCVYEPVSIEERILVPKVIRKDIVGPES